MRGLWLFPLLWAQAPEVLRFIPGRYREGKNHRIDLHNPTSKPIALGGWLLVTRDYSVRLPNHLVLGPNQRLSIGKLGGDLRLDGYPDFLIRFPDEGQPGAYVALIDEQGRLRRGLYLAPSPQVLFLPDSGLNITREGKRLYFALPSETAPIWEYVPWEPDPIIGVVRMGDRWRYTVADAEREARLYAPIRFPFLLASYEREAVHLSWELESYDFCDVYRIERSEGGAGWQIIARMPCPSPKPGRQRIEYYDTRVREGQTYQYRLVYEMPPLLRLESAIAEVRCKREEKPLQMTAQPGYLRLRVSQSQPLKIRLLDSYFTERLRIYDGWVNGGVENVFVWDTSRVRQGKWIIVWTAGRRYWIELPAR
ncbi:MAG: hypothetical protein N3E49_01200 [Bacteroidia bacterium]|nr:hypothetical protein [Bacteroidia bacterium]